MTQFLDLSFAQGGVDGAPDIVLCHHPRNSIELKGNWDTLGLRGRSLAGEPLSERRGRLELSDVRFRDNQHLRQIIDRIVSKVGRRVDEVCPMVAARLQDGSRVNAIIPPLALDGPVSYLGHTSEDSFGADSYLVERAGGCLMIDSPRFTRRRPSSRGYG